MAGTGKAYRPGEQLIFYEPSRGHYLLTVGDSERTRGFLGVGKKIFYTGTIAEIVFSKQQEQWEILADAGIACGIDHRRLMRVDSSQIEDKRLDAGVADISHLLGRMEDHLYPPQ